MGNSVSDILQNSSLLEHTSAVMESSIDPNNRTTSTTNSTSGSPLTSSSRSRGNSKVPDNIGTFLCDLNLLNYLSIHFLYHSKFYLYFELMNRDFFENVREEEMKYIPAKYLKINLYRVYFDCHGHKSSIEEHRKLLLQQSIQNCDRTHHVGFVLPSHLTKNENICRQWKILDLKTFYTILERAKIECHVHQLFNNHQQETQSQKFREEQWSSSSSSSTVTPKISTSPLSHSSHNEKAIHDLLEKECSHQCDTSKTTEEEELCCICMDAPTTIATGCCNSQFCEPCLQAWNQRNETCPMCRKPLNVTNSEDKTNADSWVTVQKDDFILPREEVANQFLRFVNTLANPLPFHY
ncbi:hypothetical protein FDP41_005987 [Naegleria fowleri]|uniref:RING-type domain-containing protein n=1 Tax=Naegleria fowleri TaxID=5763 RepID=A0A6A5BNV0_NAEFO|nr:uncharacterized protein FDP41_005987 [Naegleria fowleri]KAF0975235.1 hypothetical protein FDP41_005987 [Naegleria fowleri]CAG4710346.1 unnamed protein product [Naegleria fowleri]